MHPMEKRHSNFSSAPGREEELDSLSEKKAKIAEVQKVLKHHFANAVLLTGMQHHHPFEQDTHNEKLQPGAGFEPTIPTS